MRMPKVRAAPAAAAAAVVSKSCCFEIAVRVAAAVAAAENDEGCVRSVRTNSVSIPMPSSSLARASVQSVNQSLVRPTLNQSMFLSVYLSFYRFHAADHERDPTSQSVAVRADCPRRKRELLSLLLRAGSGSVVPRFVDFTNVASTGAFIYPSPPSKSPGWALGSVFFASVRSAIRR